MKFTTGTYTFTNGIGSGTINIGNVTLSDNVTVNFSGTVAGTYATGGAVRTIDVGTNSIFNLASQNVSTAAGTGFIKNGAGTWITAGNTYTGGFTLNAGTMALAGVNGMGGGGALTINGGTIRSSGTAARDMTGKFTGGITIGGNFAVGDTTNNGTLTFSNTVSLGAASRTITANSTTIFSGAFGGSSGVGITKNGAGTLRLNGANTFTGDVEVSNGILQIGNYDGLDTVNSLIVSGGGTSNLQLVQVGTGATTNSINKSVSLHGTLSTAGGNSSNTLVQTMVGNITLAGDSAITNNGNSSFDIDGNVILGAHTLTYQSDGTGSRIDGNITGTGSLNKTGNQGITLAGANSYTGTTTITAGTLALASTTALGGSSPGVNGTSGVSMTGGSVLTPTVNSVVVNAPITVGATGTSVTINQPNFTGTQIFSDGVFTIASAIGGAGNVTFNSTVNTNHLNNILLTAQSNYAGSTLIQTSSSNTGISNAHQIVLRLGINDALPTSTVLTIDGGTGAGTGRVAEFVLNGYNQTLAGLNNVTRNLRVQRVVNSDVSNASTLTINGSGDSTYGGAIGVNTAVNSMNVGNFVGGTNGNNILLVKNGTGTFALTGANSFSGKTTVLGGVLSLGHSSALSQSPLDTQNSITGTSTAGLRTTVTTLTLGGLTGNKDFASVFETATGGYSTLTALTLNPVSGATHSYSGNVGDGAGNMTLTKTGAGTQILSGTNTYTGATLVSAGTLFVTGSLTSDVTVSDGATVGGGGTVDDISFGGGSFFDIALSVDGSPNPLDSAGTISFAAAGFGIDNLVSGGIPVNWSSIADGTYTLITGTLNSSNLDNFGLANAYDIGSGRRAYFQNGSLQLVVIPEPSAALLGAFGLIALLRRRRTN